MAERGAGGGRRIVRVAVVTIVVAVAAVGGTLAVTRARDAGQPVAAAAVSTGSARVVRTDLSTTTQVNGTLGYAGTYPVVDQAGGVYTALPAAGAVVGRGAPLYEVDGRPVILFYGVRPAWRALHVGVPDGDDVAQLADNLKALGFAHANLVVGNHFGAALDAAVRRWQAAVGATVTGTVGLADAVYAPGPIRVTDVQADAGSPARTGATLLHGTGTDRVVNLALPVGQEYLIKVGDAVTVTMPDGRTTTPGTVTAVSSVAGAGNGNSGGNGGGNGGAQPSQAQGGSAAPLFVTVTVRLTDPAAAGNLDQAPVTVNVTAQSVRGVLAVPINALVALAEGGYAVDVLDGGARRLVAVHTGLFAASLVEVSGRGIAAGLTVEVPSP